MSDPFVAEVRIFAGNFAPRGWAFCNGQLLPIAQNTALFSLIGTTYGGDGRTTCALPNLQDRAPMHPGSGPGLRSRTLGEAGGNENVTLAQTQISSHSHAVYAEADADSGNPANTTLAQSSLGDKQFHTPDVNSATMEGSTVESFGGSQPHNNLPPLIGLNFIIALVGLYPSRS